MMKITKQKIALSKQFRVKYDKVFLSDIDGRPITNLSNFCRFHRAINRKTQKGLTLTEVQLYSYHTGAINKKR